MNVVGYMYKGQYEEALDDAILRSERRNDRAKARQARMGRLESKTQAWLALKNMVNNTIQHQPTPLNNNLVSQETQEVLIKSKSKKGFIKNIIYRLFK